MKIIFDFDGTLVDTMPALTSVATELLEGCYGLIPEQAREMYLSCVGLSFPEQLEELFLGDGRNASVAETFHDYQARIYETAGLHDFVTATLSHLRYANVDFAVCTSSRAALAQNLFMQYSLPAPDFFMGREFGPKGDQLMRLQGAGFTHFIGDAPRDGKLAAFAGLEFVGVEHTFPRSVFKHEGQNSAQDLIAAVGEVLGGPWYPVNPCVEIAAGNTLSSSQRA